MMNAENESLERKPYAVPIYCVIVKKDDTTLEGWALLHPVESHMILIQPSAQYRADGWTIGVSFQEIASIFPAFPPEPDP